MYKCIYENKTCITKNVYCSELKDIVEDKLEDIYADLEVNDPNKECIANKDKCIESYVKCEDYEENVEKEKCEAIIPEDYYYKKCAFDSVNNKCISEKLICSSFKLENVKNYCELLGESYNKKCIFSNGFCLEEKKNQA